MTPFFTALLQAAPGGQGGANPLLGFAPYIVIIGVFYFLMIRPQARKAKLHQQMLGQLKKGDDVITTGGLIGKISGIKDDEITLQVQEGVRVRVIRSAVTGLQRPVTAEAAKADVKASAS